MAPVSVYDIADPMTQDQWGTADPMSEIIARDSFNDPDKGVFVAPPGLMAGSVIVDGKVVVVTGAARAVRGGARSPRSPAPARRWWRPTCSTSRLAWATGGDRRAPPTVDARLDVTDGRLGRAGDWLRATYGAWTRWSTTPAWPRASGCRTSRSTTWHQTFDINVTGPMLGIQALVPLMPPGSSIVNICSVAAMSGHAAAAYTASQVGAARPDPLGVPGARRDARASGSTP